MVSNNLEPYSFRYKIFHPPLPPVFIGGVLMLDPRETFEKYESRSPVPPISQNDRREYLSCEYRRENAATVAAPRPDSGAFQPQQHLACEYRRPAATTTLTTFVPETNKKKLPIGLIVTIAICIPILIVIILFAAVWLQEVGIL